MRSAFGIGAAFAIMAVCATFGLSQPGHAQLSQQLGNPPSSSQGGLSQAIGSQPAPEPLLRVGIGLQSCEKLTSQLKPGAGLDHLANALLFYWVQGYISAANIHLLNEYEDYIDAGAVKEPEITRLVAEFCSGNPGKRPVDALDAFIVKANKIKVKESAAFDPWEH